MKVGRGTLEIGETLNIEYIEQEYNNNNIEGIWWPKLNERYYV